MSEAAAAAPGDATSASPVQKKPFYKQLYVQVLIALLLGVGFGLVSPKAATAPWVGALGEGFIRLIKMVVPLIIFLTVVSGIGHVAEARKVGRVAIKALIYFEVVSTFALVLGLVVGNVVQPGKGFSGQGNEGAIAKFTGGGHSFVEFLLGVIPESVVKAFAEGSILQVLLFAILFGFALLAMGKAADRMLGFIDDATHAMFGVITLIMKVAPLGAFGAMAFTVGKYGPQSLGKLATLVATFYATSAVFVFVVLGIVARLAGFSILRFLNYIKAELLVILGTSSSETVLPAIMTKLERAGCAPSVVRLTVPLGYSFNLDGTNIYMTLATIFIAQALNVPLTLEQQLGIVAIAMATSKGATGVTGAGFITLAATLKSVDPVLVPGMAIILGIDKFMSENRALTNLIGNAVACVVVAASEKELDRDKLQAALHGPEATPDLKEAVAQGI